MDNCMDITAIYSQNAMDLNEIFNTFAADNNGTIVLLWQDQLALQKRKSLLRLWMW